MSLNILAAARALIALDSRSSVSNLPVIDFLAPLCRLAGLQVAIHNETRDGVAQHNLVATRAPSSGDRLLLAAHLDTVPPGDHSLWTATGGDPFALTEREGELYGLGVADVKLDFLCKLAALERSADERLRRGVVLAGTYGEETGRYGARLLARSLRPLPALALVGEPSELHPVPAHKGYLEIRVKAVDPRPTPVSPARMWRLRFSGVAAHSSQTDRGVSANELCMAFLRKTAGLELTGMPASLSGAGGASDLPAVLSVHGGDVVNKVAARCDMLLAAPSPPLLATAVLQGGAPRSGEGPGPDESGWSVSVEEITGEGSSERGADRAAETWSPSLTVALLGVQDRIEALRRLLLGLPDLSFDPPTSTVNNGIVRLEAGELLYVADIRLVPNRRAEAAVQQCIDDVRALLASIPGIEATVEKALEDPPFSARSDSTLLSTLTGAIAHHGLDPTPRHKSGTTEAATYAAAGMDSVVFGPGQASGNIHRPNEHVPVAHLFRAIDVYEEVVRRLCVSS